MAIELKLKRFGERTDFGFDADGWHVSFRMRVDEQGALVVGHLTIEPRSIELREYPPRLRPVPAGGISWAFLRRLKLGVEARYARAVIVTQDEHGVNRRKRAAPSGRRGRPSQYSITFYRRFAARYRALSGPKGVSNFNQVLAKEFRKSESAIRNMVARCRRPKMGLIASSGRAPRTANN